MEYFKSQFLRAAATILAEVGSPLSPSEIIEYARLRILPLGRLKGKTPAQTLKAKLSTHIRQRGSQSVFVRTAPGRFFLRDLLTPDATEYFAPPLQPPKPQETILVVPAAQVEALGLRFQGVNTRSRRLLISLLNNGRLHYVDRSEAEARDDIKQIVTFALIRRGSSLLSFRRGTYTRAASYLRGARCVGFGGHVSEQDRNLFDNDAGIRSNVARELCEELVLPRADVSRLRDLAALRFVGILNDDASPVGRRHLAMIFVYDASTSSFWDAPARGEKAITKLEWVPTAGQEVNLGEFEYWSQLCLRRLFPGILRRTPAFAIRRKFAFSGPHVVVLSSQLGGGRDEVVSLFREHYGYEPVGATDLKHARGARVIVLDDLSPTAEAAVIQLGAWRSVVRIYCHSPFDRRYERFAKVSETDIRPLDFATLAATPDQTNESDEMARADVVLWDWGGSRSYSVAVHQLMKVACAE